MGTSVSWLGARSGLVTLLAVLMAPPVASGQTDRTPGVIRINAITGIVEGRRRYGTGTTATLVVANVNPFLYHYRVITKTTTYTEGAIATFGAAGFGMTITVPSDPTKTTTDTLRSKIAARLWPVPAPEGPLVDPACPSDYAKTNEAIAAAYGLERETDSLLDLGKTIRGDLNKAAADLSAWTNRFSHHRDELRKPDAVTEELRPAVESLDIALSAYVQHVAPQHRRFADSASGYMAWLAQYIDHAGRLQEAHPPCRYFHVRRADASQWAFDTVIVHASVARLLQSDSSLVRESQQVTHARQDADLWQITEQLSGEIDPVSVEVVVQRAPAGSDSLWRTVASPKIWFGRRRFGIGVGLLFGRFKSVDYVSVKQYQTPPSGAPGDTTFTVVVETGRSTSRVTPAVFLSGHLVGSRFGLNIIISSGPDKNQGELSLAYFVGLAISTLDDRMFLAAGESWGIERDLSSGLMAGSRIPAGQAVPIETRRRSKFGIALSFRAF